MNSLIALLLFVALCTAQTVYNVSFDHRAILINGERQLLISGSIHYPRSTPMMWDDLMKRSKAAGINLVETYIFWNLHQPEPDILNFEGQANIVEFLQIAQQNGLWVNLRIGPYVCAEWNYGGFPEWLKELDGVVFRDYNQPYMTEMAKFMETITDYLRPMFASNGGPIILAQVENEYGWLEKRYGVNGTKYANWAIEYARSLDIGVPWIMCSQDDMPLAINTCNGFYCDPWIDGHFQKFPNQPALWTENWPGWFQDWGQGKPKRPVVDVAYSAARWFAKGGSHMNYYMWHGGTTFARWPGGPGITNSYDYDAPLDEYGYPNEPKYSHLSQLHNILHQYSNSLLQNDPPQPLNLGSYQDGYVYGTGENEIAFLCNNDDNSSATVTYAGQNYLLPAWSCSILGARKFLFNTQTITSMRKGDYNYLVASKKRQMSVESWQDVFKPWGGNSFFSTSPPEQVMTTHDKTDYLWYFTSISSQNGNFDIEVTNANDFLAIFIDGQLIASGKGGASGSVSQSAGTHSLQLLTSTLGLVNNEEHMEQWTRGLQGNVTVNGVDITNSGWNVQPGTLGEYLEVFTLTGSGVVDWQSTDSTNQPMTWYKFTLDVDLTSEAPLSLDMQTMNKGFIWVNGIPLARYWLITASDNCETCDNYTGTYSPDQCRAGCGQPSQRYYHVPKDYLQATGNLFVVLEELGGDANGIQLVQRTGGVVCGMQQENWPTENTIVYLECDPGTLVSQVNFASFGTPQGQCQSFKQGNCNAQDSLSIVEGLCMGRSYCSIPVSVDVFGDPCPDITKSLYVQITCS